MYNPNILEKKNLWVYGYCNNITDAQGINNLVIMMLKNINFLNFF